MKISEDMAKGTGPTDHKLGNYYGLYFVIEVEGKLTYGQGHRKPWRSRAFSDVSSIPKRVWKPYKNKEHYNPIFRTIILDVKASAGGKQGYTHSRDGKQNKSSSAPFFDEPVSWDAEPGVSISVGDFRLGLGRLHKKRGSGYKVS